MKSQPTPETQAPPISGFETGKIILRARRGEIVAGGF
jgi:hypothetical protein